MDKQDIQKIRDDIVLVVLPNVPFDGWAWRSIENAAQEAGHSKAMARAVFPGRETDVLDALADWADREMLNVLSGVNIEDLRIRDRIRQAVMTRFEILNPHKEAVRASMKFWVVPTRKPRAAKIVWRTADCIWDWAGDMSDDYNRYTKRGLLSGVLVSTTLAWLNESSSENMDNTKAFLDRRIENVMQLGKVINKFKKAS